MKAQLRELSQNTRGTSASEASLSLRNFKTPSLDNFYGKRNEDLPAWIFQAEEQLAMLNVTEDDLKIRIAGCALREAAKTWYYSVRSETLPETERITTWDSFKTAMREQFSPINPIKIARDQLAELRQTGGVREYTSKFRQLCTIISPEISEWEKFDRYVRGLKPRVRREVELRDISTFVEAVKLAEKVDNNLDRVFNQSKSTSSPSVRQTTFSAPSTRSGPVPMELGAMQKLNNKSRAGMEPRRHLREEERQFRRDNNLCPYCGAKDHSLETCPVLRRPFQPKPGNGVGRPQSGART